MDKVANKQMGQERDSPIKTFVVDDSPLMCRIMTKILSEDPQIEVLGHALSGKEALSFLSSNPCDLCTLDVHMPGMNGLTVLKHIMIKYPVPTLMVSAFTGDGSRVTFEALRYGAVDFFQKPSQQGGQDLEAQGDLLRIKVKRAARVRLEAARYLRLRPYSKASVEKHNDSIQSVVVIGTSTGGYAALLSLVPCLEKPPSAPVLISLGTQACYIEAFTEYLKNYAPVMVKRAANQERLEPGTVYLIGEEEAAGLERDGTDVKLVLGKRADLSQNEGTIDLLLLSASELFGPGTLCIFLSGDGMKGITGAKEVLRNQGHVLVQRPQSCLAPELPDRVMKELGAKAHPLSELCNQITDWRGDGP